MSNPASSDNRSYSAHAGSAATALRRQAGRDELARSFIQAREGMTLSKDWRRRVTGLDGAGRNLTKPLNNPDRLRQSRFMAEPNTGSSKDFNLVTAYTAH